MPQVTCRVFRCAHNISGEKCNAAVIEVCDDDRGVTEKTDCSTFIPRNFSGTLLNLNNVNYSGLVAEAFSGGHYVNPDVACTVGNCRYRGEGNTCLAGQIEIEASDAKSSAETRCKTYRENSSN